MNNLFQVPAGTRLSIRTEDVTDPQGNVTHNVTYEATATRQYRYTRGAWRRLFVEASIEFAPGVRQIWLSVDKDDEPKEEKHDVKERVVEKLV